MFQILIIVYSKITKILEEFKNLGRIAASNRILVKYVAYKYYKEVTKNFFIVQVRQQQPKYV